MPTTPTPTPSSARTGPTRSRSSPTTSRSRTRPAARTSSSSATTCCTRSTSTTTATASPTIIYEFRVHDDDHATRTRSSTTPGRSTRIDSPNFNRQPDLRRARGPRRRRRRLGKDLLSPPCNVGIRSTPNYPALADAAIYDVGDGIKVFAGQRLDGFYVDLGSIFDLAALRPFQNLHLIPTPAAPASTRCVRSTSTRSRSRCRSAA